MASQELDYITVKGFKSIASIEKLPLKAINVVIGPNGAGKSNFIGIFSFLNAIREGRLQDYVTKAGGAEKILYFGSGFFPNRFVPFVMIHEFEGLLFSDCAAFSRAVGKPHLEPAFQEVRDAFESPEEINDSPVTAPSKRVKQLIPNYEKPLFGTLAIIEIGLDRIRLECPHFNDWLGRLESVAR